MDGVAVRGRGSAGGSVAVAAGAGDGVGLPEPCLEALGHHAEQPVAGGVAEPVVKTITRATISIEWLRARILDGGIGYLQIRQFAIPDALPLLSRLGVNSFKGFKVDQAKQFIACNEDGYVVGYADLEADGHIDHLFCAPEAVGTGVASPLYGAPERLAHDAGIV